MQSFAPFPFGQTITRLRRTYTTDPYNPDIGVPGSWAGATSLVIKGAYISTTSSATLGDDPTRSQIVTSKRLFCAPDDDVTIGDRIVVDGTLGGVFDVIGFPSADVSPFTGWQPVRELELSEVSG